MLYLRSLLWVILLPGTVTVLLPWLILSLRPPGAAEGWTFLRALALLPAAAGAGILLHSIWLFARSGRGTLSPLEPPRRFVAHGLYRFVRNPMYLGVLLLLSGEAGFFRSGIILGYAAIWFLIFHTFVILHEEPNLRRRFGDSYMRYCRSVRRWLPGRPYVDAG